LIVDRAQYGAAFGAERVDLFDIYLPRSAEAEAVRERILRAPWSAEHALSVLTRAELRGHILGMISRLYGVAYAQEIVAGIVAALGVVATLFTSVLQRQRELGLLRALGMTPRQVVWSVVAEAFQMASIGIAIGLCLGVPLAWYVLRVLLFQETGFTFPVSLPWNAAGVVGCAVIAASAVASLAPALKAARMRIAETIAYE
jgi:putative ABC transport system permease protein